MVPGWVLKKWSMCASVWFTISLLSSSFRRSDAQPQPKCDRKPTKLFHNKPSLVCVVCWCRCEETFFFFLCEPDEWMDIWFGFAFASKEKYKRIKWLQLNVGKWMDWNRCWEKMKNEFNRKTTNSGCTHRCVVGERRRLIGAYSHFLVDSAVVLRQDVCEIEDFFFLHAWDWAIQWSSKIHDHTITSNMSVAFLFERLMQ